MGGYDPDDALQGDDYGIRAETSTLAERVRELGYATAGLSGNYGYLRKWTGLQRGFTSFDDRPYRQVGYHPFLFPIQRRLLGGVHQELVEWDAPSLGAAALAFVSAARRPFFLFINYFDAHGPHFARDGHRFRGDGVGSDAPPVPAYDSEIAYLDASLGDFLNSLRGAGVLDRSIVVITSDHGEFFGERSLRYHRTGG